MALRLMEHFNKAAVEINSIFIQQKRAVISMLHLIAKDARWFLNKHVFLQFLHIFILLYFVCQVMYSVIRIQIKNIQWELKIKRNKL